MATDSVEALGCFTPPPPRFDPLVTDLVMPGLGGDTLAREFLDRGSDGAVLFISGYTNDDAAWQGLLEAGQSFLPKPFTPMELATRVQESVRGQGVKRPPAGPRNGPLARLQASSLADA